MKTHHKEILGEGILCQQGKIHKKMTSSLLLLTILTIFLVSFLFSISIFVLKICCFHSRNCDYFFISCIVGAFNFIITVSSVAF